MSSPPTPKIPINSCIRKTDLSFLPGRRLTRLPGRFSFLCGSGAVPIQTAPEHLLKIGFCFTEVLSSNKPSPPRGRLIITLFQAMKDRWVEILPVSAWRVRSGNRKHPGAVACGVAHLRPPRGICLLQEKSLFACFERGFPARPLPPPSREKWFLLLAHV